jgi:hypothetical protein
MQEKPNQVSFTVGKDNKKLLNELAPKLGCKSRSDLLKQIIEQWLFTNKFILLIKNEKRK